MKAIWPIRLLCFYLLIIPATIIIASTGWLCAPLPDICRYKIITSWSHIFIWWAKISCGLKYKVTGLSNLPDKPYVVVCNHQSAWETIFMQVLLPPQSWVLKKQLLYIPFFGWGLALIKPIAVSRNKLSDIKVIIKKGTERIQQGRCVVFYPEGTRLKPNQTKKFSRTAASLAISAKVPVVPIAHNAGKFWPKGFFIKQPGIIKITIGKPISGNNASEITTTAENWINTNK